MDRVHYNPCNNIDHYFSQTPQENGPHASQPQAGQTSAERPARGGYSEPSQPHLNPNLPGQIPSSSGANLEYILQALQSMGLGESTLPQPEAGQTSAGEPARGAAGNHSMQNQLSLNPNLSMSEQILSLSEPDLEYVMQTIKSKVLEALEEQPLPKAGQILSSFGSNMERTLRDLHSCVLEDITQNDASPDPQLFVEAQFYQALLSRLEMSSKSAMASPNQSGLKRKAITYPTPEGGHASKSRRLSENPQPGKPNEVLDEIEEMLQRTKLNSQTPEPSWLRP
ncbi:MAG: hypothetical protein P8X89_23905 [Reinekea sp.]